MHIYIYAYIYIRMYMCVYPLPDTLMAMKVLTCIDYILVSIHTYTFMYVHGREEKSPVLSLVRFHLVVRFHCGAELPPHPKYVHGRVK